ncbi:MAG: hypothetical protein HON23_05505 [Rickettsiales bacterium]|nr:hypothetical protein [Rickettsiales bacterium]
MIRRINNNRAIQSGRNRGIAQPENPAATAVSTVGGEDNGGGGAAQARPRPHQVRSESTALQVGRRQVAEKGLSGDAVVAVSPPTGEVASIAPVAPIEDIQLSSFASLTEESGQTAVVSSVRSAAPGEFSGAMNNSPLSRRGSGGDDLAVVSRLNLTPGSVRGGESVGSSDDGTPPLEAGSLTLTPAGDRRSVGASLLPSLEDRQVTGAEGVDVDLGDGSKGSSDEGASEAGSLALTPARATSSFVEAAGMGTRGWSQGRGGLLNGEPDGGQFDESVETLRTLTVSARAAESADLREQMSSQAEENARLREEVAKLRAQLASKEKRPNARYSEAYLQGLVTDLDKENKYIAMLSKSAEEVFGDEVPQGDYLAWRKPVEVLYKRTIGAMVYRLPDMARDHGASDLLLTMTNLAKKLEVGLILNSFADLGSVDWSRVGFATEAVEDKISKELIILENSLIDIYRLDVDEALDYVAHPDTQTFVTAMTKLRLLSLNLSKKSLTTAKELSEKRLLLNHFVDFFKEGRVEEDDLERFLGLMEVVCPPVSQDFSASDRADSGSESDGVEEDPVDGVSSRSENKHLLLLKNLNLSNSDHKAALEKYFGKSYDKAISELKRYQKGVFANKGKSPGYESRTDGYEGEKYKVLSSYNATELDLFSQFKLQQGELESASRKLEDFYHTRFDYFRVEQYMDLISEMPLSEKVTLSNMLKEYIYAFKKSVVERYDDDRPGDLSEQERFDLDLGVATKAIFNYSRYKTRKEDRGFTDTLVTDRKKKIAEANAQIGLSPRISNRVQFLLSLERLSHRLAQDIKSYGVDLEGKVSKLKQEVESRQSTLPPESGSGDGLKEGDALCGHEGASQPCASGSSEASDQKDYLFLDPQDIEFHKARTGIMREDEADVGSIRQSELDLDHISRAGLSIARLRESRRTIELSEAVTAEYQELYKAQLCDDGDTGFAQKVKEKSEKTALGSGKTVL